MSLLSAVSRCPCSLCVGLSVPSALCLPGFWSLPLGPLSLSLFDPVWLMGSRSLSLPTFFSISHCICGVTLCLWLSCFFSLSSQGFTSMSSSPPGCLLLSLHLHLAALHSLLLGPDSGFLPCQLPMGDSEALSGDYSVGRLGTHSCCAVQTLPRAQKVKPEGQ